VKLIQCWSFPRHPVGVLIWIPFGYVQYAALLSAGWLMAEYDPPLMSACQNALADEVYFPIAQLLR
jgi:hypothetical protein